MENLINPVLSKFPSPKFNAFLMMTFADIPTNQRILETIRKEADRYAINVLRADDQAVSDDLWANVKLYMEACDYGIAVFDHIVRSEFNPNVTLEVGYMLARQQESRVLLLKERSLPKLPSDIAGKLYREFDASDLEASLRGAIREWLRDIGVAKSFREKVVVFVSTGGQDRCAMAKVVATKLLTKKTPPFPIRFISMAAFQGSAFTASDFSRKAIESEYHEDLLKSHRVMRRCDGIVEDADLILVMERQFLELFPPEKTRLITEFFGASGEVDDPYPSEQVEDYLKCLHKLRALIEGGYTNIFKALDAMALKQRGQG